MPDLPEPTGGWPAIPMIETTDRVLGGANGPANAQARALAARSMWLKDTMADLSNTMEATTSRIAASEASADAALQEAAAAALAADTAENAAAAATLTASGADSKATAAQSMAAAASTNAGTAVATADAATNAVAAKATRIDLGTVSLTYTAGVILGAGARSVSVACSGAQVNDAVFVAATGAVPDGYAVGAAQCLTAGQIRVSIVHPALALNASFTIPLRVFALR